MRAKAIACFAALTVCCLTSAMLRAQTSPITRTQLQKIEAPDPGHSVESYLVTIAPQAFVGRHTHPGVEVGYLVSGSGTLTVDGAPERTLQPGDSWAIPAGTPHSLHNSGDQPEKLVVTYVLEKGKPLTSMVP